MLFKIQSYKNIGRLAPIKGAEIKDVESYYSWGTAIVTTWAIEIDSLDELMDVLREEGEIKLGFSGGIPQITVE